MRSDRPGSIGGDETSGQPSLLDQVLGATRETERTQDQVGIKTLVTEAMKGTVTQSKDLTTAIQDAIEKVEREISDHVARILHDPAFQALEASWRGLFELVRRSEDDATLKIKLLDVSKDELTIDLAEGDVTTGRLDRELVVQLEEVGEPLAILLDDHDLIIDSEDVGLLGRLAALASSVHCLLVVSGSPTLCGLSRWSDLNEDCELENGATSQQASAWETFRMTETAKSVILPMPRVLARRPYGAKTSRIEEFPLEELGREPNSGRPIPQELLTWMNPAYIVGVMVNEAYVSGGRPAVNELLETGGRLGNLICFYSKDEDGDPVVNGPVEVYLDRHRDAELRDRGFSPLQFIRNSESVVLNGFRTPHLPGTD